MQRLHRTLGEALRRGQRRRKRQFNHEVSAAAHGHFGTRVLIQHGKIAALDEIAAHHGNDSLCASPAHLFQMIQVTIVQGIVFADNTTDFHV